MNKEKDILRSLYARAYVIGLEDLLNPPPFKSPTEINIPVFGETGLIVRPLAISLCYSDVKIFDVGIKNSRVRRGVKENGWIIPGHEVIYQVLETMGTDRYKQGDVIYVQPNARYQNSDYYLGFTEPGGLSTRNFISERFLGSNSGGNVLRLSDLEIDDSLALIEPWSCVEADFTAKIALEENRGDLLVQSGSDPSPTGFSTVDGTASGHPHPSPSLGSEKYDTVAPLDIVLRPTTGQQDPWTGFTGSLPKGSAILIDAASPDFSLQIDLHDIHYRRLLCTSRRNHELWQEKAGWRLPQHYAGHVLLLGGAGPMGQMYLRRLLMESMIPEKITIVDRVETRLWRVTNLFERWAPGSSRLDTLCIPNDVANTEEVAFISNAIQASPDAIVIFSTDLIIVEHCIRMVKDDGLVNVFAGMPANSRITISGKDIERNIVLYGRSGSSLQESMLTISRIRQGELRLYDFIEQSVSFDKAWEALMDVRQRRTNGKTLVTPPWREPGQQDSSYESSPSAH